MFPAFILFRQTNTFNVYTAMRVITPRRMFGASMVHAPRSAVCSARDGGENTTEHLLFICKL